MKVTSRSSNRLTSIYSRSKVYDPSSDASDLESDESTEEEATKTEEAYQSEDEEMDELEELLQEEEEEEEENEVEQEENEQIEDDVDVEAEEMDDGEATPVDDDEFDEEEESEEEEEQSDYEEAQSRKSRSRTTQNNPSKPKQVSSVAESSPTPENRVLTKRQRAKLNENYEQDLLQLPMEPMRKKQLTEEEIQLKKSEIARRRKNQSIQRAEQDKMDTINRLLKKQASKKRLKDQDDNDVVQNNDDGSSANIPNVFHYVTNQEGCSLSVPRGVNIPIEFSKGPKYPPPVPICSFSGCQLPKKYRSTKTFEFACSMEHLRKIDAQT
ncbi:2046_t:CDS:2 [Acaulospora morrowiae]|uniref:2046_t:CDS:1 n=1 Tax=Acaulospora morrowiae TaxID=94023 RepID=A0A9N9EAQ4_9GLOM|nr:2046_t:CDS:2 [Acaulospora morrowiae]